MDLSAEYFEFLAARFPVMCASDEFHFLPRVAAASRYYDKLENLDHEAVAECIEILKEFQRKFDRQALDETELEESIDLQILKASAGAVLFELENTTILAPRSSFLPQDCLYRAGPFPHQTRRERYGKSRKGEGSPARHSGTVPAGCPEP